MLTEDKRTQLDEIVSQMTRKGENSNTIEFVVNDFKNKYAVQEPPESFLEKTADVLDLLFGGGKVGEAIGTKIAEFSPLGRKLKQKEEQGLVPKGTSAETFKTPSIGEVAGSALQSAALFTPVGTVAKGITAGVRGLGMVKGASALGKIASGALAGEVFDVASNLQQGKTGRDALTPGLGTIIGGGIPAVGVAKNVLVRFGNEQAPRVINSLIKPLAKDFSYGKNPGRAVAEHGIVASNFDDLIDSIRTTRQKIGQEIGELGGTLSEQPVLNIRGSLVSLDTAMKTAASQNNQSVLNRLNNVKRAITTVLEPQIDDAGNIGVKAIGSRDLENLTFKQARNILSDIGDMTQFTGSPSDDKIVNSALKGMYGKIKETTLDYARATNPSLAEKFSKLTESYADLHSAEIAAKYRDKIIERQNLIGLSPTTAGIGSALITAIATGGATIPTILVGLTGAVVDKLASTPGFKTRLAFMLSKKTIKEASFLFRKVPALSKFFSTKAGVFPGDIVLGEYAPKIESKIAGAIKNPMKLGLSIKDVSGISPELQPLAQEAQKYNSAEEFVKSQENIKTVPIESFGTSAINDLERGKITTKADILNPQITDEIGIDRWVTKIKNGERPPVEVETTGRGLQITDGSHRLEAYRRLGVKDIPVVGDNSIPKEFYNPVKTKSQLTDFYNKVKVTPSWQLKADYPIQTQKSAIAPELQPLAQENPALFKSAQEAIAQGKSAEQFVNNAGSRKVGFDWDYLDEMRATKESGGSYSFSDFNNLSNREKLYRGKEPSKTFYRAGTINKSGDIYLTDSKEAADMYANTDGSRVGEYKVLSNNTLDATSDETLKKILGKDFQDTTNDPSLKSRIVKYAKDNGYDSVELRDTGPDGKHEITSFIVWDKNLIKTKSQLRAIYDDAKKRKP